MPRSVRRRVRPVVVAALTVAVLLPLGVVAPAQARTPEPVTAPVPPDPSERFEAPPPSVDDVPPPVDGEETIGAVVVTEDGLEVVTVEAGPDELDEVEDDLAAEPEVVDVVDVFVDVPVRKAASNDTHRDELWNLDAVNIDLLPDGTPTGAGQIVAVLDTGVRASHPDLLGRVDCTRGADFSVDTETSSGNACTDPDGHGTHVAGIVSAISGNAVGVAGVSAATIMPVRVLDAQGNGTAAGIIAGIIWAVDHDASVINLSISGEQSAAFDSAIQYALDEGVVVVAAAGNNRADGNLPQSPSSNDGVIAVAATDEFGLSAPYSYSGPTNLISAPGDFVLSTIPTSPGYAYASGSSMAAPHVAGIVARYRAINPGAGVEDIRTAIQATAIDLQQPGFDNDTGHGLIDMRELLTGADAPADPARGIVPAAPTVTSVTPGQSSLTVSWTPPAYVGASALTGYGVFVVRILGGEYVPVDYRTYSQVVSSATIDGLVNGATYEVYLVARNLQGEGQWSVAAGPVRPRTVPGSPDLGTPTALPSAARVRWSPTSTGGSPITGYIVQAYRGSTLVKTVTAPATARDVKVGGLLNERAHEFVVRAVNAIGQGDTAWTGPVTPTNKPGAPTIGRPTAVTAGAKVPWAAPANPGASAITSYTVTAFKGNDAVKKVRVPATVRSLTVTGLRRFAYYTFSVVATNASGTGPSAGKSARVFTQ